MRLFDFLKNNSSRTIDPMPEMEKRAEDEEIKEEPSPALLYFTEKYKDVPINDGNVLFDFKKVYMALNTAAEKGIIQKKEVNIGGTAANMFVMDAFAFVPTKGKELKVRITMEENGYEHLLFHGPVNPRNGAFKLEKTIFSSAFFHFLKLLPEKIRQKEQEEKKEAAAYFTKKYRIRSLKY